MSGGVRQAPTERPALLPRRIVALGGGTGLPAVLRGLRALRRLPDPGGVAVDDGDAALTAIVTMTDDGGSSGRLRRTRRLPPPGDVRNCLVALAEEEDLLADLFQHRYEGPDGELGGHSVGNLILAALAEREGSFLRAVEMSSRVLRTAGRILPSTEDDVRLSAELRDGTRIVGETEIAGCEKRIRRIRLEPHDAAPTPGVVDAILDAELVVLGPGSVFSSLIPNILVPGVAEALRKTEALVVLVGNLVSEKGEDAGLDLRDHVGVIEDHAGGPIVDALLANEAPIDAEVLARYREEGAVPLYWSESRGGGVRVLRHPLISPGSKLRHDPPATASGLLRVWSLLRG